MYTTYLEEAIKRAKDGVIDLGTANGWNQTRNEEYRALEELKVPGSQSSKNLGNCYNEYRFIAIHEGQSYVVLHTVDSGD